MPCSLCVPQSILSRLVIVQFISVSKIQLNPKDRGEQQRKLMSDGFQKLVKARHFLDQGLSPEKIKSYRV